MYKEQDLNDFAKRWSKIQPSLERMQVYPIAACNTMESYNTSDNKYTICVRFILSEDAEAYQRRKCTLEKITS